MSRVGPSAKLIAFDLDANTLYIDRMYRIYILLNNRAYSTSL